MQTDWVDSLTEDDIRLRLTSAPRAPHNPYPPGLLKGDPTPAGVLLPLLRNQSAWHLLFIRRSLVDGDMHSGQVAFPGGAREPGDASIEAAALREAQEEIALPPEDVRILGALSEFLTISNYRVTPFVGVIPWPFPMRLAEDEVSRAFTIPLAWLLDPAHHREEERHIPGENIPLTAIFFDEYDGELLWGASARFTLSFLEAIAQENS